MILNTNTRYRLKRITLTLLILNTIIINIGCGINIL